MKKYLIPTAIFILASTLALYNIGNFPKMIGDEGIYVSQAYWLAFLGKLGPYTYWYDHFPLGWVQIGLWQAIVGPFGFLGYTVLSARVFMGLVLGGTTTILYLLSHHLTKSKLTGALTSLIFITSTLTLTFGRMVLLDNLATFWLLLGLLLLFINPHRLKNLIFSAVALSLAILSKESLLFFLPPYLFCMYYLNKENPYKRYALLVGTTTLIFLLSFFPLLSLLKDEFFPQANQVSFLGTLIFQAGRGSGIPFWQTGSHFREMMNMWITIDPNVMFLGLGSTILSLLLPIGFMFKSIAIFSVFFLLFLMRGGQIYEFYIIPLTPLFALSISLIVDYFGKITRSFTLSLVLMATVIGYFTLENSYPLYSEATKPQKESIDALGNLPRGSTIVANNYPYLDISLITKNNIHWYQKIESDSEIRDDAQDISHILVDVQFANELSSGQLPYLESLLNRQSTKIEFGPLLAPGENVKPFSTENLTLYTLSQTSESVEYLVNLDETNLEILQSLSQNPPYGVLITRDNFTNSTDLETYIARLKSALSQNTQIIVTQDDTGSNTIPWITTSSRQFYKSSEEASASTGKKTDALKKLGFTGAVISSSADLDDYLPTIIEAAKLNLNPIIRFENDIPQTSITLLVSNKSDLELIQNAKFPGQILLLVDLESYQEIKN